MEPHAMRRVERRFGGGNFHLLIRSDAKRRRLTPLTDSFNSYENPVRSKLDPVGYSALPPRDFPRSAILSVGLLGLIAEQR